MRFYSAINSRCSYDIRIYKYTYILHPLEKQGSCYFNEKHTYINQHVYQLIFYILLLFYALKYRKNKKIIAKIITEILSF